MSEWYDMDPGRCPDCGEAFQWVRPGKSQSQCDCWRTCHVHGPMAIDYHEFGEIDGMTGWFCLRCAQPENEGGK